MKRIIALLFLLVVLVTSFSLISYAQTTLEPDYNFCSDPLVWGNGNCANSDPNIEACMWEMGWYLPRVAMGEFGMSDIQSPCLLVVANSTDTTIEIQVKTNSSGCNYIVVVFNGSPYTGKRDIEESTNLYDGSDETSCLEIHGNDNTNIIIGGSGDDLIFGYGGGDYIEGGAGNDTIYGGDESCAYTYCNNAGILGDEIHGGDGDDIIYGGNETCNRPNCNEYGILGDTIDGGAGDDTIYGGDESCNAEECNTGDNSNEDPTGLIGDRINGGDGNDTIYGGDESCSGDKCNFFGTLGDTIDGGDGDDTIMGGDESCSGDKCNWIGIIGDTIDGGADTDTADGGNETDNGSADGSVGDSCSNNESESDCP